MPIKNLRIIIFLYFLSPTFAAAQTLPDQLELKKFAPGLYPSIKKNKTIDLRILTKDKAQLKAWMKIHLPEIHFSETDSSSLIVQFSRFPSRQLSKINECPWIEFIDFGDRRATEERAIESSDLTVNNISTVHRLMPQFSGQGLAVSVKEKPFDKNDIDFRGRVINFAQFPAEFTTHATLMATLIAGGGNSSFFGRGVASKALLTTADFVILLPDDGMQLRQKGVSVQNHSYGVGIENYYGIESQAYDKHCFNFPEIVHVFSAGNQGSRGNSEGNYKNILGFANLTGQFKMSKNTLCVGETDETGKVSLLSSRGPANDGRIKPELVAFGDVGTSEAAALVSGISLLVQDAYRQKNGSQLPPSSLVKAVLFNSAADTGRPEVDFESGFGSVDANGAIKTIQENRYFIGEISQDQEKKWSIQVPDECKNLKVTLAWTDPESNPNAAKALFNDLDLEVRYVPTGQTWEPWVLNTFPHSDSLKKNAVRKKDRLNNAEQVTIAFPQSGEYELTVKTFGSISGQQAFSLAYEYPAGFQWLFPVRKDEMTSCRAQFIRWEWNYPPAIGEISFKTTGDSNWKLIEEGLDLSEGKFLWEVADTLAFAQFRIQSNNESWVSDTFAIQNFSQSTLAYNCPEEAMLFWPKQNNVQKYQIFTLGEAGLVAFTQATDTTLVIKKNLENKRYFAVAPVLNDQALSPNETLFLNENAGFCYVKKFLPQYLVNDTIHFDAALSTTFRLETLEFEKKMGEQFISLQKINKPGSLEYAFVDAQPSGGRNVYRLKLKNIDQQFFYSKEEEAFLIFEKDVLIFPNPIAEGEKLTLITETDEASVIQFLDQAGRFLYEITDDGITKSIDTQGLVRGVYFLRIRTQKGHYLMRRLLVL